MRTMSPRTRSSVLFLCASIATELALPVTLSAQDRQRATWDVTLGAGAAVRPTYEGSDRYIVSPVPFVNVIWNDTVALNVEGLSAYWRYGNLRVGGGLTYDTGRSQSTGTFQQGDYRLAGMGDIPAALALKAFADYRLGPVVLNAAVKKLTANGNDGVVLNFGMALPYKLTESTMVRASVSADWANQSYMQTHFGVTAVQAANSGYAQYNAGAGIQSVNFGLGLTQKLGEHWELIAQGRVMRLTGDTQNSPIVFSTTQAVVMGALAYHF
ncbi:Outer membrane scaffolding protein for murein synthesis, MipA/OmpV family [Enhydrobacter aerosaccus]|uniref:Outer membrane scaffolding protein for murein synthesis, MipA/OmpV family n=1 Tax=Enhydrobacter aerosaccus TaxID=225324 RepID=A0A1T4KAL9_9HYPH|nr:MipA/OmpV family protein [Enhydrobacter aerosaccus]SJZ39373.1 Outer membrane scaffolding protein for murein synthesis, MipA/OmpV family [Enhydrobacter aerosaccus]